MRSSEDVGCAGTREASSYFTYNFILTQLSSALSDNTMKIVHTVLIKLVDLLMQIYHKLHKLVLGVG